MDKKIDTFMYNNQHLYVYVSNMPQLIVYKIMNEINLLKK